MNIPLGVSPSKGKQGTTRGKDLLTSVGIEPTTSGLDLLSLCRLSYEVPTISQRCKWKDTFCIVREHILKYRVVHPFETHIWLKSYVCFLSRLNEINGSCEKILSVSGSLWSNLKFFRMMDFTPWLWGWNVRVNGILLLFSFWDVCSTDCRSNKC